MTFHPFLRPPSTQFYGFSLDNPPAQLGHTCRRKEGNERCSESSEKTICFRRALLYKIRIFNSPCSSFLSDTFFPLCRSFKFKRLQEMGPAYHRITERFGLKGIFKIQPRQGQGKPSTRLGCNSILLDSWRFLLNSGFYLPCSDF